MRTLAAPLGEINAEAWLRAQYSKSPPVASASPAAGRIQGLAGDALDFEVVSSWPRDVVTLRWYLDDAEIFAARDTTQYRLNADGGTHRVRVDATDTTGRIRAPGAAESRFSRSWTVSPDPVVVAGKAALEAVGVAEWLQMRVDQSGHSVAGRVAAEGLPLPGPTPRGDWEYALLDDGGQVVARGTFADPRLVQGPMPLPGEAQPGHRAAVLPFGHYLIALPRDATPRKLRIGPVAARQEKLGEAGSVPGAIELLLDAP
jgi:hypothetical protein